MIKNWLPVVLLCCVIFFLSNQPKFNTGLAQSEDFILKKVAHFCEYFLLGLLTFRALKNTTKLSKPKIIFFTIAFAFIYALTDEFHQSFIPGREPRFRDVLIDTSGAISAVSLLQARL